MTEFKGKNRKDLVKTLSEKQTALQTFRFGVSGGKTRNVKEGKNLRKDIARIHTELSVIEKAEKVAAPVNPKVAVKAKKKAIK